MLKQTLMTLGTALVLMAAHADEPTLAPGDLQQKPAQAAVQGAAPAQPETPRASPAPDPAQGAGGAQPGTLREGAGQGVAQPGNEQQARRTGGAAAAAGEPAEQRKPPAVRNKNTDGRYGASREGAREGKAREQAAKPAGSKERMSPYERRNKQREARGNKRYNRGGAAASQPEGGN